MLENKGADLQCYVGTKSLITFTEYFALFDGNTILSHCTDDILVDSFRHVESNEAKVTIGPYFCLNFMIKVTTNTSTDSLMQLRIRLVILGVFLVQSDTCNKIETSIDTNFLMAPSILKDFNQN